MADALQPRATTSGPLLRGGGELHIVGSEEVTSIPDPDGAMYRLFILADGSRSTSDLHSALVREYPQLDEQDVVHAVLELASAGLFEDCATSHWALGRRARDEERG